MEGLTGAIKFDADGLRTNFHLSIVGKLLSDAFSFLKIRFLIEIFISKELQMDGLAVVGTWNGLDGANFSRMHTSGQSLTQESLFNKTLIVTTIQVR